MSNIFTTVSSTNNQQSQSIAPLIIEIDDLCKLLNIGKNTAYKLLTSGQIESFKVGSVWKIPISAVNEYIDQKCKLKGKKQMYRLLSPEEVANSKKKNAIKK